MDYKRKDALKLIFKNKVIKNLKDEV